MVKRIKYDTFGNVLNESNPAFAVPFGFAGGLYDRDTKLVRFGYRDYDPETGRWTAKDPIGFSGGDTDLYGYCLNDPVNLYDPAGLWTVMGGLGARVTLPGIGAEGGFFDVRGSEKCEDGKKVIRESTMLYAEIFAAGGLSFGKGLWGGIWTGDVSELFNAAEIGLDLPLGFSISFLFDESMNWGITVGTPSEGAGAFGKIKPLHKRLEIILSDNMPCACGM